jgi:hypothetical protein
MNHVSAENKNFMSDDDILGDSQVNIDWMSMTII